MRRREQGGDGRRRENRWGDGDQWKKGSRGEIKTPGRVKFEVAVRPPFPWVSHTEVEPGVGSGLCVSGERPPAFLHTALEQHQLPSLESRGTSELGGAVKRGCLSPWCSQVKEDQPSSQVVSIYLVLAGIALV